MSDIIEFSKLPTTIEEKINKELASYVTTIDGTNLAIVSTKIIGEYRKYYLNSSKLCPLTENRLLCYLRQEDITLKQETIEKLLKIDSDFMYSSFFISKGQFFKFCIITSNYNMIIYKNDEEICFSNSESTIFVPRYLFWLNDHEALCLDQMRDTVKLITLNYHSQNYTITDITLPSEYQDYKLLQIIQHPTVKNHFYCHWKKYWSKGNPCHIITQIAYASHTLNTIKKNSKPTQIDNFSNMTLIRPHDNPDTSIHSSIPERYPSINLYYLKDIIFKKLSLTEGAERLKNLETKLRIIHEYQSKNCLNYQEKYEKFKENHPASKNFIVNWISELIEKEEKT